MRRKAFLIPLLALALAAPAWAQQPAATPSSGDATFDALAPLVAARVPELHAAGVEKVTARTGRNRRDIQVLTRWGPAYFGWPKGVKPVEFELRIESPNTIDLIAPAYNDAAKPTYRAAFDAVLPQALRTANQTRANASRPKS